MSILLGTTVKTSGGKRDELRWMPDRTINGHGIIVGASGVGKTYRIRRIAHALAYNYGARVIIIDVHGDIEVAGENRINFSESSSYGLNPLWINPDPHSGGVNRRIRAFISMINRTSHALGSRQEPALRRLLEDLYRLNGFDANDYRTWDPRTNPNVRGRSARAQVCPNISDLKRYTFSKLKQLKTGAGGEAFKALTELTKHVKAMHAYGLKADRQDDLEVIKLQKLIARAKDTYAMVVDKLETGAEIDDMLRYTDAQTLDAVLDRIDKLDKSGIFKDAQPPVDPATPVTVYNIKSLGRDEQKMFVDVLLEDLWQEQRGYPYSTEPRTFVVIDEASIFLSDEIGRAHV